MLVSTLIFATTDAAETPTPRPVYAEEQLLREPPPPSYPKRNVDWIVRQGGGSPLTTVQALQLLDDPVAWDRFHRRQRRDLTLGIGLAVVGGAATMAALILPIPRDSMDWVISPFPLFAATLVAAPLLVIPLAARVRRARHADRFFDEDELDHLIADHNTALASELALPAPAQVSPR